MTTQSWRYRVHKLVESNGDALFFTAYPPDRKVGRVRQRVADFVCVVQEWLQHVACSALGHEVEDDQCGISEHRYCIYCMRGFPNGIARYNNHLTTRPSVASRCGSKASPSDLVRASASSAAEDQR